jgi:hypothetical protein
VLVDYVVPEAGSIAASLASLLALAALRKRSDH